MQVLFRLILLIIAQKISTEIFCALKSQKTVLSYESNISYKRRFLSFALKQGNNVQLHFSFRLIELYVAYFCITS